MKPPNPYIGEVEPRCENAWNQGCDAGYESGKQDGVRFLFQEIEEYMQGESSGVLTFRITKRLWDEIKANNLPSGSQCWEN